MHGILFAQLIQHLFQHPNGELWLYYKSWAVNDWKYDLIHGDGIRTTGQCTV